MIFFLATHHIWVRRSSPSYGRSVRHLEERWAEVSHFLLGATLWSLGVQRRWQHNGVPQSAHPERSGLTSPEIARPDAGAGVGVEE